MRIYTQTDFTDLLGAQEYYLIVSLISGWKLQRQMLQVFVCVLKRVSICLHVGKMLNNFNDHIWIVIRGLSIIFVSFTLRETERERVGQRGSEKVKIFFPSSLNHQDASCGFLLLWIHCVCVCVHVRAFVVTFAWFSTFVVDLWEIRSEWHLCIHCKMTATLRRLTTLY